MSARNDQMARDLIEYLKGAGLSPEDILGFASVVRVLAKKGNPDEPMRMLCKEVEHLATHRVGELPGYRFMLAVFQPNHDAPKLPGLEAIELCLYHSEPESANRDAFSLQRSIAAILEAAHAEPAEVN